MCFLCVIILLKYKYMVIIMELKKQMEQNIYDMEKVAQLFDIEPFGYIFTRWICMYIRGLHR